MPVRRRERQCGGNTATALVAAARMGCRCAMRARWAPTSFLNSSSSGSKRKELIQRAFSFAADARPVHSTIIVDQTRQTRTILYELANGNGDISDLPERPAGCFAQIGNVPLSVPWPEETLVRSARVLFVDHSCPATMLRAARIARAAGIPVVADLENDRDPLFAELLGEIRSRGPSPAFRIASDR